MAQSKTPKFALIIPTYNRAHTVGRAIDSVGTQGYPQWHAYIVDDGSTDTTETVLQDYAKKYKGHITCKKQVNGGVGAARNTAIDLALERETDHEHVYFLFLDSDDEITPDSLTVVASYIAQFPDDDYFVFGSMDQDGRKTYTMRHEVNLMSIKEVIEGQIVAGEMIACVRARVFEDAKLRFDATVNGAETLLWWELTRRKPTRYIDRAVRVYHTDEPISIIRSPLTPKSVRNLYMVNKKTLDAFGSLYAKYNRRGLGQMYLVQARIAALHGRRIESLGYFFRGLRHSPLEIKRIALYVLSLVDYRLKLNNALQRRFAN